MYYIHFEDFRGPMKKEVVGYDSETFKALRFNSHAKDKNHAYYCGRIIEGADPETFKPVNKEYSVDANSIFYMEKRRSNASPESLRILKGKFALDSDSVYYSYESISEADPETFKILKKGYSRDKNYVFYENRTLHEVQEPDQYKVLCHLWGRDSQRYYFKGAEIKGADYNSFQILRTSSVSSSYAKDKNHVYYCSYFQSKIEVSIIEGADIKTFKIVSNNMSGSAKDKNGFYNLGKRAEKKKN